MSILVNLFFNIFNFVDNTSKIFGSHKPGGFWNSTENIRLFLEKYARKMNFDPLIPDNWYTVTHTEIMTEKVIFFLFHIVFLS